MRGNVRNEGNRAELVVLAAVWTCHGASERQAGHRRKPGAVLPFHEMIGPIGQVSLHERVVNPRSLHAGEVAAEAVEELRQLLVEQGLRAPGVFSRPRITQGPMSVLPFISSGHPAMASSHGGMLSLKRKSA